MKGSVTSLADNKNPANTRNPRHSFAKAFLLQAHFLKPCFVKTMDPPVAKRNLPWTRGLVLWRTRFGRA